MLRLYRKILPKKPIKLHYKISNWKLPASDIDSSGIIGFFQSRQHSYLTLSQKLYQISPPSLYQGFSEWTRELLITLSVDYKIGIATSIVLVTLAIKTLFLYPTIKGQMQGLRQHQIRKATQIFQQKMKIAQMTGNRALKEQAVYEHRLAMKKVGINPIVPLTNLLQLPFLISWFFSLEYMSKMPGLYPQMTTQGFLWFSDLTVFDPYFVVPVMAAVASSISIAYSPNMAQLSHSMPPIAPYISMFKYLPFTSLFFSGFFPASVTLYWLSLSVYQLLITQVMHSKYLRRKFGVTQVLGQENKDQTTKNE